MTEELGKGQEESGGGGTSKVPPLTEAQRQMDKAIKAIRKMPGAGREFSESDFWKTSEEREAGKTQQ
jgi:hypothetical protein